MPDTTLAQPRRLVHILLWPDVTDADLERAAVLLNAARRGEPIPEDDSPPSRPNHPESPLRLDCFEPLSLLLRDVNRLRK